MPVRVVPEQHSLPRRYFPVIPFSSQYRPTRRAPGSDATEVVASTHGDKKRSDLNITVCYHYLKNTVKRLAFLFAMPALLSADWKIVTQTGDSTRLVDVG